MFKSIATKISHRHNQLSDRYLTEEKITLLVKNFLREIIGPQAEGIVFTASFDRGVLSIRTKNKTIASEIIMNAKTLYATLKREQIIINKLTTL